MPAKKTDQSFINSMMSLVMGQGNVLVVHTALVEFLGHDFAQALLLEQLLYWTPRTAADGWIAKSDADFCKELYQSRYAIRAAREALERKGYIELSTHKSKFYNFAPVIHYKVKATTLWNAWMAWAKVTTAHLVPVSDQEPAKTNNFSVVTADPKVEAQKEQTRQAMERGYLANGNLKERVEKALNVLPNWKQRGAVAWLQWLSAAENEGFCTIEQFSQWWNTQDWRGKQGQPPTLDQVRYCWPQAIEHKENLPEGV